MAVSPPRHPKQEFSWHTSPPLEEPYAPPELPAPPRSRAGSVAHRVAAILIAAAVVAAIVFCVAVGIERDFGHAFEAFLGAVCVFMALAARSLRVEFPGKEEVELSDLQDGLAQTRAVFGVRLAWVATWIMGGGWLIAHAVGAVSPNLLVRGTALALVPMCIAFAVLRWVARTQIEEMPASDNRSYTLDKPSKMLERVLASLIDQSAAMSALFILATAAFLVLVASSPSLAATVGDVISWPFRFVDQLFNDVKNWIF